MALTETWFDSSVSDQGPFIRGFGCPTRLDCDKEATGKERGGGVCLYVNERWCKNVIVRDRLYTPDIELLTVSLRPLHLSRECRQLFVTAVYILVPCAGRAGPGRAGPGLYIILRAGPGRAGPGLG